jgi:hypothetical protein
MCIYSIQSVHNDLSWRNGRQALQFLLIPDLLVLNRMSRFNQTSNPVVPLKPEDPDWPESHQRRCERYQEWYSLFWKLQVIQKAIRYADEDARRAGRKR